MPGCGLRNGPSRSSLRSCCRCLLPDEDAAWRLRFTGNSGVLGDSMLPPIRFYLPEKIPADMPQSPDVYWTGFWGHIRGGVYAWTVQTFQRLRDAGMNVELSDQLPTEGILVAHRKS